LERECQFQIVFQRGQHPSGEGTESTHPLGTLARRFEERQERLRRFRTLAAEGLPSAFECLLGR